MIVRTSIVVVYKKKLGKKVQMKEFTELPCPDKLITNSSKLLPKGAEVLEIGVGSIFEQKYKKKYKL